MEGRSGGRPQTRYVETSLGYLAYQVFGSGPRDIFFVTGALTNLDAIWDEPSAARFLDRLAGMGRVIHHDMRGSGVSDPIPGRSKWLTIEDTVDDLRAVLDAARSERAVLYGDTEGGMFTTMMAAVDPARVLGADTGQQLSPPPPGRRLSDRSPPVGRRCTLRGVCGPARDHRGDARTDRSEHGR